MSLSDSVHRSIANNANRAATSATPLRLSTWAPDGWQVECVTTPAAIAVANAEDPALPVILDAAEQAATHGEPVYLDFGAGGRWRFDLPTFDLPYDNPPAPQLCAPPLKLDADGWPLGRDWNAVPFEDPYWLLDTILACPDPCEARAAAVVWLDASRAVLPKRNHDRISRMLAVLSALAILDELREDFFSGYFNAAGAMCGPDTDSAAYASGRGAFQYRGKILRTADGSFTRARIDASDKSLAYLLRILAPL